MRFECEWFGVFDDFDDFVVCVNKDHIERNVGVLHPEVQVVIFWRIDK